MGESYFQEVELPSKGLPYGEKMPGGLVSIEPLGTREEKLFASGKPGSAIINKIFENCVKSPVPVSQLVLGDRMHLLLQLRSVSYGDQYTYPFKCQSCGEKSYGEVSIQNIPVKQAPEAFSGRFDAALPFSGKKLELRLLTGEDEDAVERYVKQLQQRTRGQAGDDGDAYVMRLARRIESIDGSPVGIQEVLKFIDTLKAPDMEAIRCAIEDNDVGPELRVEPTCTHCHYEQEAFVFPLTNEFFRARRRGAGNGADSQSAVVPGNGG